MVDSALLCFNIYYMMNRLAYGLITLVALTLIAPALAMAESENEENEGNEREGTEANERESTEANESREHESAIGSGTSSLILYVTLAAIAGVAGYSAFRVYQARKKATKKLV